MRQQERGDIGLRPCGDDGHGHFTLAQHAGHQLHGGKTAELHGRLRQHRAVQTGFTVDGWGVHGRREQGRGAAHSDGAGQAEQRADAQGIVSTISNPLPVRSPSISSESTRFLSQPNDTNNNFINSPIRMCLKIYLCNSQTHPFVYLLCYHQFLLFSCFCSCFFCCFSSLCDFRSLC